MRDIFVNDFFQPKQAQTNEAGTEYNRISEYPNAIDNATRLQVHNKTLRTLCVKSEGTLHTSGLEALLIVHGYFTFNGKQKQHRTVIINWSGALFNWKRRVFKSIDEALKGGFLIEIGKSIIISDKGKAVIEDYNKTFEQMIKQYLANAERDQIRVRKQYDERNKKRSETRKQTKIN